MDERQCKTNITQNTVDLTVQNDFSNSSWETTGFVYKQLFGNPMKYTQGNPVSGNKQRKSSPYVQCKRGFRSSLASKR